METVYDVQQYLRSRKYNMTAKGWLQNNRIQQLILEEHLNWNEDFIRFNPKSKKRALGEIIEYYLKSPWLLDGKFHPPL